MELVNHLCFKRYRQEILVPLTKDIFSAEVSSKIESDEIKFCHTSLSAQFGNLHLVNGNRGDMKEPEKMFEWLWLRTGDKSRRFFANKSFRIMFRKVDSALQKYKDIYEQWKLDVKNEFFAYHWIIPYPNRNGTLVCVTKDSKRMWYSVLPESGFIYGAKDYQKGELPAYPRSLSMSKAEMKRYLES